MRKVAELTRASTSIVVQNRNKFHELLEASRSKIARHLGVTADETALVRNTSEANNIINNGFSLKSGDEVVLWDQNHPSNNVAWDVRAARFGLAIKRVRTPAQPANAEELLKAFESAFGPRTRVLALTHVSNVSGLRLPVRELAESAHRKGIFVHVDGAQSWGALHVDLRQLGCDSYSASAHKWFMGPKEVGQFYVRKERIGEDLVKASRAPGWECAKTVLQGSRKFESLDNETTPHSRPSLPRSISHGHWSQRMEMRVQELAVLLKTGMLEAGVEVVTPLDPTLCAGGMRFRPPLARAMKSTASCGEEHGIAGALNRWFAVLSARV